MQGKSAVSPASGQSAVSPGGHAGLLLPIVAADGVQYQSGLVSVEGNPELEVDVRTAARRVDVGEFVDAAFQPGRGLLGVFSFIGDPAEVKINITRHPGYPLRPAIVELAEMHTEVSAAGVAETWARYRLRTKALYLQIDLPPQGELWTAELDGQPVKPQEEPGTGGKPTAEGLPGAPHPNALPEGEGEKQGRPSPRHSSGGKLLVSLPAAGVGETRTLRTGLPGADPALRDDWPRADCCAQALAPARSRPAAGRGAGRRSPLVDAVAHRLPGDPVRRHGDHHG